MAVERFFSETEKKDIVAAIVIAEKNTSGEIRLHLQEKCGEDVFARAVNVFSAIGMDKTRERNGVLFYLAVSDKKFAIVADKGINDAVPADFWNNVKEQLQRDFAGNNFSGGLCAAIEKTGRQLSAFFPLQEDDANELSNDISVS